MDFDHWWAAKKREAATIIVMVFVVVLVLWAILHHWFPGRPLYLFISDLLHQILFYIGGVLALLEMLLRFSNTALEKRLFTGLVLLCFVVACYQAWIDEHQNVQTLIEQKSQLTSENYELKAKLDAKQVEVDFLRDHQTIIAGQGQPDPMIARILDRLEKENQILRTEPAKTQKKGLVSLTREMADFFQREATVAQNSSREIEDAPLPTDPTQRHSQWKQMADRTEAVSRKLDSDLQSAMMVDYQPRATNILEQIRERGKEATGIADSEIDEAKIRCAVTNGAGSYWGFQECIERLSVLAQKVH